MTVFEAAPWRAACRASPFRISACPRTWRIGQLGHILELGVRVLTNTEVGRDVSLREIMERHDACLLAVGSRRERMLSIPGIGHGPAAVSFLREANLSRRSLAGKRVVILGGGGVAFDCAFTARRLGAESVSLICPETRDAVRVPPGGSGAGG